MQTDNKKFLGLHPQSMAILLMITGTTCNTLGYIFANEHRLHPVATNLIRGFVTTIITYLIGRRLSIDLTFPSAHNFKYQNIRNAIMLTQGLVYSWVQFYLPLPVAVTLQATSPIFATIFDRLINNNKLNKAQVGWLVVAFVGVLLTANGELIFQLLTGQSSEANSSFVYFSKDPLTVLWASMILLAQVCLHGYAVVMTKVFTNTNSIHINYSQGVLLVIVNGLLYPFTSSDSDFNQPTPWQAAEAALLMGVPVTFGLLAFAAALLMTTNYALLTPFMFTAIIFSYLVSVIRYGQEVNIVCLLGAIAIVTGIVNNVRNKNRE